jgi:hypothetical protein
VLCCAVLCCAVAQGRSGVLRGAVFAAAMSKWGTQLVPSLPFSYTTVLMGLAAACSSGLPNVVYEVRDRGERSCRRRHVAVARGFDTRGAHFVRIALRSAHIVLTHTPLRCGAHANA